MLSQELLSQEKLKKLLDYNQETGIFTWRVSNNRRIKIDSIAGTLDSSNGYIRIKIFNKRYQAHRLAWLYIHSVWPNDMIDHINGIKNDNRLPNLRESTNSENMMNKGKQTNNTSGYKGVSWHKQTKKWAVRITVDKQRIHLGYFDNLDDAADAYQNAAICYHGNFAYTQ